MPIEIKELHIKINVSEGGGGAPGGGASEEDPVAQSIEQVMELLKQQKER